MNKLPITKIAQEACRENVKAAPFKMYVNKFAGSTGQVIANQGMSSFSQGLEEGDKMAKKTALKSANKGMIDDKNGCGEGFVYDNEKGECVPQQKDNDLTVDNSNDPNAVNLDD
tara:strand:- start:600 stop:941 length:342 start_codon:yes stop_codon:yes gene_type:complete